MKTTNYLIALAACCAVGVSSAGAQTYSLTDLGFLPNKKEDVSTAAAINNSGEVTGTSGGAAFRYSKETMEEIGQNPYGLSRGFGIDGSGQVVGDSTFDKAGSFSRAALFSNGYARDLGNLRGGGLFSRANGINASGLVVGFTSETLDGNYGKAFMVDTKAQLGSRLGLSKRMVDLGTLGGLYAQAWGINDSGFVTGNSETKSDFGATHAFVWHKGTGMIDLGTLAGDFSYGTFINANNHVVGYSTIDQKNDRVHAFLHNGKEMIDLGSLGGASSTSDRSFALGVNASVEVVGYSYLPSPRDGDLVPQQEVAFVYSKGVMVNLNDLIGDAAKEYRLDSATAINDRGQIVAVAFVRSTGTYRAVLLTPTKEGASAIELERKEVKMQITHATYSGKGGILSVQVAYPAGTPDLTRPVLSVYETATKTLIGTLKGTAGFNNLGTVTYVGSFIVKSNPQMVTVVDNYGKTADAAVKNID